MRHSTSGRIAGAIGLAGGVAAIALLAVAAVGTRAQWWHFSRGITLAEWAAYGAIAAALVAVAGLVLALRTPARKGLVVSLAALLAAAPLLAAAGWWTWAERAYPPINDITTDTAEPPNFWDMPNPMDYPGESAAEKQKAAYPDIVPLQTDTPADKAYAEALGLVRERGWEIVADAPEDGRIEAIARSRLFGFADEIIVRVTETETGSRIDMRSRSRVGRVDRGVNAARIKAFMADLDVRLAAGGGA